jgi:cell division protein FtsB
MVDVPMPKAVVKKTKTNIFFIVSIIVLIIGIGLIIFSFYYGSKLKIQINYLENKKVELESQIQAKEKTISEQQTDISQLKAEINNLKYELQITKQKLEEMTKKYEEAKPYQERVNRGQNLYQSYNLLSDYEDYTQSIVLAYLGLNSPTAPANDDELWERGKKIYNWISSNYDYCGDKGLRVGTTFYEFQFFSPDELLMSDNVRCGDCDDFSTLFAGLMYASGVPENKVWVICGSVGSGGHCWNWLSLSDQTYRIDPVCSQKQTIINILGLDLGIKGAYYTSSKGNVDCFSSYDAQIRMNPDGFHSLS